MLGLSVPLHHSLLRLDTAQIEMPEAMEQSLDPQVAKMLSFGHLPALVDGLLIRSYSDPAYDPVSPGTHPPLFFLLRLATELDPHFFELYWMGGSLLSIVRRDGPGAAELLDRAHEQISKGRFPEPGFQEKYWSYAWQLELMRGYNAIFELGDFEKAAEAFEWAGKLPGGDSFLKALAKRLSTTEGRFEVALRSIQGLLQRKNSDEVQEQLEVRARDLKLGHLLFVVDQEFRRSLSKSHLNSKDFVTFQKRSGRQVDPLGGTLAWDEASQKVTTSTPRSVLSGLY